MFDIQERLDSLVTELERSWPKNFERILREYPHKNEPFYIFTFCKFDCRVIPWEFKVYHQPRQTKPDPVSGTTLMLVDPKNGTAEIVWTLPHREGFNLYQPGKVFEDKVVNDSIKKYLNDELIDSEEKFQMVK